MRTADFRLLISHPIPLMRKILMLSACLAVLPGAVHADSIVQFFDYSAASSNSGSGPGSRIQTRIDLQPFCVEWAQLTSVEFACTAAAYAGVTDSSQFAPGPIFLTPSFSTWMQFDFIEGQNVRMDLTSTYLTLTGEPVLVEPRGYYGLADNVELSASAVFTDERQLAMFASETPILSAALFVFGTSWAGGSFLDGNMQLSVKYNYTVPDAGATLPLLGAGLCALVLYGRRRRCT